MKLLFAVIVAALATLTFADVSHLGSYNYPAPVTSNVASFTPRQTLTPTYSGPQVESIRSSIPIASFTIRQNVGQAQSFGSQSFGSQSFSNGQSSGSYNYNAPNQQHFTGAVQEQSYTGPSAGSVQPVPAIGSGQRSYLPPAPQQQVHSFPASGPVSVQESLSAPEVAPVQNTYLPPATAPVHQQTYAVPSSVPAVQHVPASVQQSFSGPAVVQQQSFSSVGQVQEQSFEVSGHQQQPSFGGVGSTTSFGNGAYNYQAPVQQQQSFPGSSLAPNQQSISAPVSAPVQQTYSVPSSEQHQSFSTSSNVAGGGSYNYQPAVTVQQSFSAPAAGPVQSSYSTPAEAPIQKSYTAPAAAPIQQTLSASIGGEVQNSFTGSSGGQSGSYNYQPPTQIQQQFTVPAATPVQLAVSGGSIGVDSGSFNNLGSVSQTTAPISNPQGVEYSVPAPQKVSLPTPVSELSPPAPAPEVGTVYGSNGGYVYRKFK